MDSRRIGRHGRWSLYACARRLACCSCSASNQRNHRVDRDGLPFLRPDLGQDTGSRGRNLCVDFIRGDLKNGLVPLDGVAHLF